MSEATKRYISPKEAADILDISYETVLNLISIGKLPFRKVGGRWRARIADIDKSLGFDEIRPTYRHGNSKRFGG